MRGLAVSNGDALAVKKCVFSNCPSHRSSVTRGINGYLLPDYVTLFDLAGISRSIPEHSCRDYGYGWIENAMGTWTKVTRKHLS